MKGKLKVYLIQPLAIVLLAIAVNGAIIYIDKDTGLILAIANAGLLLAAVISAAILLPHFNQSINDYAAGYTQMQRRLLDEFEVPFAILDDTGKILWANEQFLYKTKITKEYHKPVSTLFSGITKELLLRISQDHHLYLSEDDCFYHIYLRRVFVDENIKSPDERKESVKTADSFFAIYLFDETQLQASLKENEEQKLVTALVYIDNYEEAVASIEEVKRSLLIALVDRKINQYFANSDSIVKKVEKDKYFVIFRKKFLQQFEEDRFSLIEDVKTIKIGNEMLVTLSIGVGNSSKSYMQNYEYTRAAIDLALGRGGDQAVVKSSDKISYYGGKTEQVEKVTRVKARIKAQALREILTGKDQVIVMGHKLTDIDAFGAAIGIHRAATVLGKKCYIVINEVSSSLLPIKATFENAEDYGPDMFVTSERAIELCDKNTAICVVDTNKPSYTECPMLLNGSKTIVVFDHHRQAEEYINNAVLSYIEPYASSTCEMISEVLQYFQEDIRLDTIEADALYAGMLVDTNSFMAKTGVRTFEAAAYLKRNGADVIRVRKLLRNEMNEYKARAEAVRNAETYRGAYAISVCPPEGLQSPTIAGAQAANELLNIVGIKASFVLTEYQDRIYVSARSIDEVNVQLITEKMGGGGHMNIAGAQLVDVTMDEAIEKVKETIDQMIEEGELQE